MLQALYSCGPFRERVAAHRAPWLAEGEKESGDDETLLTCLRDLFNQMTFHKKRVGTIGPKKFVAKLKEENIMFRGYQQQDAHEFLIFILNQLHTQLHRALPAPNAPAPQAASGGASSSAAGTSIISRVFQGKLRSDVRCCGCGAASTTFDHFFDLPLDLTKVRAPGLRILDTDA